MILTLNCGSSSLKFGAYRRDGREVMLVAEGEIEEIGDQDYVAALERALGDLKEKGAQNFEAVGHRFVHGGPRLREHFVLDANSQKQLEAAVEFAPLHMPPALAVLHSAKQKMPDVPQVICLDTAFHRHMPDLGRTFALPERVRQLGVERYGFHGLSLESILHQLPRIPSRLVVAHLGNGASVTAIRDGISIDTSMGLTPAGGFLMGTRPGDLDPGVLIYLLRHGFDTPDVLEQICNHESGLLGLSSATSDVRKLTASRAADPRADLALRLFTYQVRKTIAAMAAALGGVDLLVFTGGIGEHATDLLTEIVDALQFLGIGEVRVLPSREDEQIARNTVTLLSDSSENSPQ
jgi:acetate kinase